MGQPLKYGDKIERRRKENGPKPKSYEEVIKQLLEEGDKNGSERKDCEGVKRVKP